MNISSRNQSHPTPPSPSNIITSEVLIQSDSDSDLDETHGLHVSQDTAAQTSQLSLPSDSPHSLLLPPRPANDDSLSFERTEEIAPPSSSLPEAGTHLNVSRRTRDDLPDISNKNIIDNRTKNHHDVHPNSSHHARRRQKAYQPIAYRVKSPPLHHYYRQTEDNLIRHQPSISICRPFCMLVIILILSLITYLENVGNILSYHAGNGGGADERRFHGRVRVKGRVKGKVSGENGAGFKLFGEKNISARVVVNGSDAIEAGEDAFEEEEHLLLFPTIEDGQNLIDSQDLDDDDSIPVDDDGYGESYFDENTDKQINDLDVNVNVSDDQDYIHISSNEDFKEGLVRNENVDVDDIIIGHGNGGVTNATNNLDNTGLAVEGISAQHNINDYSELENSESEGLSIAKSNTLMDDLQADVWSKMDLQNKNNTMYSEATNTANDGLNKQNITTVPTNAAAEDENTPLPEGWIEDILPQLGTPYYYNKITGESSLERPLPDAIVGEETNLQIEQEDDIHFGLNGVSSENAPFP